MKAFLISLLIPIPFLLLLEAMGNEGHHPYPLTHAERIFKAQIFDKPIEGGDEHANASIVFARFRHPAKSLPLALLSEPVLGSMRWMWQDEYLAAPGWPIGVANTSR